MAKDANGRELKVGQTVEVLQGPDNSERGWVHRVSGDQVEVTLSDGPTRRYPAGWLEVGEFSQFANAGERVRCPMCGFVEKVDAHGKIAPHIQGNVGNKDCPGTGRDASGMQATTSRFSAFSQDLKPGDRVWTPEDQPGKLRSVDGQYATVDEDSGYAWRGRLADLVKMSQTFAKDLRGQELREGDRVKQAATGLALGKVEDVQDYGEGDVEVTVRTASGALQHYKPKSLVKMAGFQEPWGYWFERAKKLGRVEGVNADHPEVKAALKKQYDAGKDPDDALNTVLATMDSVHVDSREETAMATEKTGKCPVCHGTGIPLDADGTLKVHPYGNHDDRSGRATACKGNGLQPMSAMDLTEVEVAPDGGVCVEVDPSGDEAAAGTMSMFASSATCPYCSRATSLTAFGALGDHRVAGGVCDGSGRGVASLDASGRAVLMALSRGDNVTSPKHGKVGVVLDPNNGTNLAGKAAALVRWDDGTQSQEPVAELKKR